MRLGIMQPYFFPYIGYFALIARTDAWVVFDVAQYTPKSWMNRNRVLHPSSGWMYVTVPLDHGSQGIRIDQARLVDREAARRTVLGKLSHYRRSAPHYREVAGLVDAAFGEAGDSLVGLNVAGLENVCRYLGIEFKYQYASDLALQPVDGPGGWAPMICEVVGANGYLNPVGGRELFDPADFERRGVGLGFLTVPPLVYGTGHYGFEPDLSIIDVLMWNGVERVREAIDSARIENR